MSATPPTWTFHLARATAFSVVSTGLGAAAHLAAGGCLSTPAGVAGLSLALVAGLFLSLRERRLGTILAALAGVQLALHVYFCYACMAGGSLTGTVAHLGHLVPGPGMAVTHLAAIGFTALWLAWGERALWRMVREVGARLIGMVLRRPVPVAAAPRPAPIFIEPDLPHSALLHRVVQLRGPPAGALAGRH